MIIPFDAQPGDKPKSAYVVQLPFPFADRGGQWDDKQAFPADPLGLAKARELVAILKGPGQDWPRVRIIKRTEEVIA